MTTTATPQRSLSICICTRNRPSELQVTLDSIRAHGGAATEVVVSDDSTGPETSELIEFDYPDVRYVAGPRRGLGPNRNSAARAATGEVVLFLDDDCRLGSDFLDEAFACLESQDSPERTIVTGRESNRGNLVAANDQSFLGHQSRPYDAGDTMHSVVINSALFPRALFDRVQFDERLVYGYDEIDITSRATAIGYRIVEAPNAVNNHFPSPVNRSYYARHVTPARLYVTFKRYALTQRRPLKAMAFLVAASAHAAASMAKERGPRGILAALAAIAEGTWACLQLPVTDVTQRSAR